MFRRRAANRSSRALHSAFARARFCSAQSAIRELSASVARRFTASEKWRTTSSERPRSAKQSARRMNPGDAVSAVRIRRTSRARSGSNGSAGFASAATVPSRDLSLSMAEARATAHFSWGVRGLLPRRWGVNEKKGARSERVRPHESNRRSCGAL